MVMALLAQKYEQGGLIFRHVSRVTLRTDEELPWSLDGEYAPSVPDVEIVNRRGAMTLLL